MFIPKPMCNKCGKEAPIDKEKSNENWKVYDLKKPCECGGEFEIVLQEERHPRSRKKPF